MRPTTPRRLRAHRAARRWCESGDALDVPIVAIENAVADAADLVERDLDVAEVAKVCSSAVRAALHDREQAEATAAMAGGARR